MAVGVKLNVLSKDGSSGTCLNLRRSLAVDPESLSVVENSEISNLKLRGFGAPEGGED